MALSVSQDQSYCSFKWPRRQRNPGRKHIRTVRYLCRLGLSQVEFLLKGSGVVVTRRLVTSVVVCALAAVGMPALMQPAALGMPVAELNSAALTLASATPTFQDSFSSRGLNLDKWSYRSLGERQADSGRLCSESSRKSVRVPGDGYAYLEVKRIPLADREYGPKKCPYGEWYNAQIGTQGKFSFRYGTMAMRVKFQHQRGQHGGFWSQPNMGNSTPGGAEIDAVEYFGDGYPNGGLGHYVYCKGVKYGGIKDSRGLLRNGKTWSNSFHVYSVDWTPSRYIFRIDGNVVWRLTRCISTVQQYLILSLLTSGWELPRLKASNLNPMKIDWVRVWQRP
ncbi:MAG: glycoside hydrolase family 16 protein [Chloroflexota bacterium]|nr:glycoside hydrolase family 16 protein [Chloroflexota bacterium]